MGDQMGDLDCYVKIPFESHVLWMDQPSKTLESLGNHDLSRFKIYSKPDLLCSSSAFMQCFHGYVFLFYNGQLWWFDRDLVYGHHRLLFSV